MKNVILLLCTLLYSFQLLAQSQYEGLCCPYPPGQGPSPTSYDIYKNIQKLSHSESVLYIAAHPDDENTNLIAYLSNHLNVNTSYLSLTRGDGGQNRIGSELRERLGVIRTQELLNARTVDGGHQYFSRANDFGYSKTPDETLDIWDEEKLLEDIVWVIRKVRPSVIINRFDHRTPGTTHGHHTASAILSVKAFDMAGDENAFPEQLKYVSVFQPERLFLNQSPWFYDSEEEFEKAMARGHFTKIDVGVHYYGKGISNNQMAAQSRTQHRCQGMGTTPKLGKHYEYLELIKGKPLTDSNKIFKEKNLQKVKNKEFDGLKNTIEKITTEYNFSSPYESLPALVDLYQQIEHSENEGLRTKRLEVLKEIILDCASLHIVPLAKEDSYIPGDTIPISIEMVNQSTTTINFIATDKIPLPYNELKHVSITKVIPSNESYDNPYWLDQEADLGMYKVPSQQLRGLPETPNKLAVNVLLELFGKQIPYSFPIAKKYTDPVVGQIYDPVKITPPVFVKTEESVYLFPDESPRFITIEISAGTDSISGTLFPGNQKGWSVSPDSVDFALAKKGMSRIFEFELKPPKEQEESLIQPYIVMDGKRFDKTQYEIRYQHIPRQLVFLEATSKVVRIDLKTRGKSIAYLMGAGDGVPEQLRQIGYEVDIINQNDVTQKQLQNYDALILGIRAYNVIESIPFRQEAIFEYAKSGGTVIVQYNTNHRLLVDQPGPYPMQLSKDRVTKEDASVTILKPDHELLNYPNPITSKDFNNWVQERGLYFPSEWDERYQTIISCHDPDESPKTSGLLYAKYGEGHFIYTGYSFFRQLPAGVPGAFRLFANLISIGKEDRP